MERLRLCGFKGSGEDAVTRYLRECKLYQLYNPELQRAVLAARLRLFLFLASSPAADDDKDCWGEARLRFHNLLWVAPPPDTPQGANAFDLDLVVVKSIRRRLKLPR